MDRFDTSWLAALGSNFLETMLTNVSSTLITEREELEILPPAGSSLLFNAFQKTHFNNTRVVILGMD